MVQLDFFIAATILDLVRATKLTKHLIDRGFSSEEAIKTACIESYARRILSVENREVSLIFRVFHVNVLKVCFKTLCSKLKMFVIALEICSYSAI